MNNDDVVFIILAVAWPATLLACYLIGLMQATLAERRDAERHCLECQRHLDADHKKTRFMPVKKTQP